MTIPPLADTLTGLLNLPDLVLLAFLIGSVSMGAQRGFLRTLIGLCGRLFTMLGAAWLAKQCAPALAKAVVAPIVGDVFTQQAGSYFSAVPGALDAVQDQVTATASKMAEGVAFLILLSVFIAALTIALKAFSTGARMLTKFPPFGLLNRAAGAALGLVSGIALTLLLLWLTKTIRPDLFEPLGYFAPDRIANTVLLRALLDYLPII